MDLATARRVLDLPADYTLRQLDAAFRNRARQVHPDVGGGAEAFHELEAARDRARRALRSRSTAARSGAGPSARSRTPVTVVPTRSRWERLLDRLLRPSIKGRPKRHLE